MMEIIFGTFLTTLVSFFAFLLSKLCYAPIERYKELKARTSYIITYYANIYNNPIDISKTDDKLPDDYRKAQDEIRMIASEWRAFIYIKSFPYLFIPRDKKIVEISSSLIGLSNSLTLSYRAYDSEYREVAEETERVVEKINKVLKLKI